MNSKQNYALVGALVLVIALVWWGSSKDTAENVVEDTNQVVTTPTTPVVNKKPSTSTTGNTQTSVNPTVTPVKPVPVPVTAKGLSGSSFRLVTYNGTALPSDSKYTLNFTETHFSLKLCNTLSSYYYISSTNFKADNVVSTMMYCSSPSNIMKMESDVSLMLNSGMTTIYRSGSTLILSHNSGIVLAFEGF